MIAMVHDNTQLPLIDYSGMALAAGFKHRITYTKRTVFHIYLLLIPHVSDKIPPIMQAMFDTFHGAQYEYSEDVCYELCEQVYT